MPNIPCGNDVCIDYEQLQILWEAEKKANLLDVLAEEIKHADTIQLRYLPNDQIYQCKVFEKGRDEWGTFVGEKSTGEGLTLEEAVRKALGKDEAVQLVSEVIWTYGRTRQQVIKHLAWLWETYALLEDKELGPNGIGLKTALRTLFHDGGGDPEVREKANLLDAIEDYANRGGSVSLHHAGVGDWRCALGSGDSWGASSPEEAIRKALEHVPEEDEKAKTLPSISDITGICKDVKMYSREEV